MVSSLKFIYSKLFEEQRVGRLTMSRLSASRRTVLWREGRTNQRAAFRAALSPQTDGSVRLLLIV